VKPGQPIRVSVRSGAQKAVLTGTMWRRNYAGPLVAHAAIAVRRRSGSTVPYRLPQFESARRHITAFTWVGVPDRNGALCLVRFHPGQPAVAMLALGPLCMLGCEDDRFFPAAGGRSYTLRSGQLGSAIDVSSGPPVLIAHDPRFW